MKKPQKPRRNLISGPEDAANAERKRASELGDIAKKYWIDHRTQSQIAEKLNVDTSTVTRRLKEAFDLGVVDITVDKSFAVSSPRDDDASRRLRDEFGLNDCLIVSVRLLPTYSRAEDDYLHLALAHQAGRRVQQTLESGTHVCVSGGRAAHQTARVIVRPPPAARNVRITPLCGRAWAHSWESRGISPITRPLDADDVAVVLARGLADEPGTVFSQAMYPLFARSSDEAARNMNEHCRFMTNGQWRGGLVPDRALVGVGAVDLEGGHRFADLIRGDLKSEIAPHLLDAATQLNDAYDFVRGAGLPPFGDVGNRLFPVLPFPDQVSAERLTNLSQCFDELLDKLNKINARMVIADWTHLRSVRRVLAIAGGPQKVAAIWTLLLVGYLHTDRRIVNELCTDSAVSERVLAAYHAYRTADAPIRNWYGQMTRKLFIDASPAGKSGDKAT